MSRIPIALALFTTLHLVACDEIPGTLKAKAHQAVRNAMFDPDAAKFRNDRESDNGQNVCGEVNGKNRLGAYVGFSKYIYLGGGISLVSPGDPDFREYYRDVEKEFSAHDAIEKLGLACVFAREWVTNCSRAQRGAMADNERQCKLWNSGATGSEKLKKELGISSNYE